MKLIHDNFGICFNYYNDLQRFEKKLNNPSLLLEEGIDPLAEFVFDYYEMEYIEFKLKFKRLVDCKLNDCGCILGKDNKNNVY
jgi:hypothetical protein